MKKRHNQDDSPTENSDEKETGTIMFIVTMVVLLAAVAQPSRLSKAHRLPQKLWHKEIPRHKRRLKS